MKIEEKVGVFNLIQVIGIMNLTEFYQTCQSLSNSPFLIWTSIKCDLYCGWNFPLLPEIKVKILTADFFLGNRICPPDFLPLCLAVCCLSIVLTFHKNITFSLRFHQYYKPLLSEYSCFFFTSSYYINSVRLTGNFNSYPSGMCLTRHIYKL